MYVQSWIQANGCYSRWFDISSTSPIPVGTDFKDTDRICIPYVLSNVFLLPLNHLLLVYKRGKATPDLGAFHSSDMSEFYGSGVAPDFIGTDALGAFLSLCFYHLLCWLGQHVCSVNFVNTGNPTIPFNSKSLLSSVDWRPWNSSSPDHPLLTFLDSTPNISITYDTYRVDAMNLLNNISLEIGGR